MCLQAFFHQTIEIFSAFKHGCCTSSLTHVLFLKVKVWFQNRRTKYKRQKIEEKAGIPTEKQSDDEEFNVPEEIELDEEEELAIDREEEEYARKHLLVSKNSDLSPQNSYSQYCIKVKHERQDDMPISFACK